ncbi:MAG: L,D-transpeptidase [Alphaproteobacteria bacterium]|nr:L,D-transpeptidase [Alphaproteobacteria bacterium]MBL6937160.1 L,D-transpeptidase [Alphaproteobacteria bacterium]MBL7096278.1 L,D-transpeptidase [Alphaproteobacteria bacterium]
MDNLRGVAGLAALAMLAMTGLMHAGQIRDALEPAASTVRIASTQANDALRLAMGGQGGQKSAPVAEPDPQLAMTTDAAGRLRDKIPADLYPYFDVYLYVSKAAEGALAQHLYIFHKDAANNLVYEENFPVSTGRERHERYFTSTPVGLFELDPNRFETSHYSRTWHARMPWAMFLNATIHGKQTGVALHSSGNAHAVLLGNRASGGCVRLPPEKAAELFHRFQKEEQGMVPVFAYDSTHNRTSGDGLIVRDSSGNPVLAPGYRVLVFIEDYPGGPALVAVVA